MNRLLDAVDRALAATSPTAEPRSWDSAADAWFEMALAAARDAL